MLAARFFLGAMEASISPAMVMITAQYFKKDEQFQRNTFWWSSNGAGNIVGAALAFGLVKHKNSMALEAWKVLFLATGCFTLALSFILFFHLPDTPATAWFLTERERQIAVERIRVNQQGFGNKKFKKYQLIEAFKDVRTYLYFAHGVLSTVPNGSLTSFGSILIKDSFGFSESKSLLLSMPNGACQFGSSFFLFFAIKFFGHRTLVGYTKKGVVMSIYLVSYCIGNMIGPQTFKPKFAPDYKESKVIMAACSAASLCLMVILYFVNVIENKRRDKESKRLGDAYFNPPENYEFMDLTDFENKNFRYVI
ncbi:unnamed protein product [Wickerhamomyces anomalus]